MQGYKEKKLLISLPQFSSNSALLVGTATFAVLTLNLLDT
jgi:hypothetical protein